jgi:hypothetical protein
MIRILFNQVSHFRRISVPKYLEAKIQEIALLHLELPDMGRLRDRLEGQLYYDRLKKNVFGEYAFERIIGIREFDWEKRESKHYVRGDYLINDKNLSLITLSSDDTPLIIGAGSNNYVFAFVNQSYRVYISGLITKSQLSKVAVHKELNQLEIIDFSESRKFSSIEELFK